MILCERSFGNPRMTDVAARKIALASLHVRLTFVHSQAGRFDIDLSLSAMEAILGERWLRVHRSWIVNVEQVRALERDDFGTTLVVGGADASTGLRVPVARDKAQRVREALLTGTTGIGRI
jgi:two-component system, LytTR family, response regulator LytT